MRLRSAPADQHAAQTGGRASLRAASLGGGDGPDQQLAQIFHNMRVAMKVSREALARRLATDRATVEAFEAGAVTAFPHWKETVRIVQAYCQFLHLDPEPILWRIKTQLQATQQARSHLRAVDPVTAPPPSRAPAAAMPAAAEPEARPRRRGRRLLVLTTPLVLLAVTLFVIQTMPQPIYRSLVLLPDGLARPIRGVLDYAVQFGAPTRDGLKWIELGDPQLRKADKLQ